MYRCHICNELFSNVTTSYPDGLNPCPECVGSYKEDPVIQGEDDPGEISLDELDPNDSEVEVIEE